MDTTVVTTVAILFCVLASSASAIRCYQCNLECRNNTAGCDGNTTTDPDTNSTRLSCDIPAKAESCVACMKIVTAYRRYDHKGEFIINEVESKICQKRESPYSEDQCDYSGPGGSQNSICYCYSDLCNSAQSLCGSIISIIAFILYAVL